MEIKIISKSIDDTKNIAKIISNHVFKGEIITLNGDLGAGKTTLTKYIGKNLNIKEEINSPTFNILKCYFDGKLPLYHIDAYRLEGVNEENMNIGLEEVIEGDGICLIEWSIYIKDFIPASALNIKINSLDENSREFIFNTENEVFKELFLDLEKLK